MFRRHWKDPGFWKWWWRNRLSESSRRGAGLGLVILLLAGGWLAADRLTSAGAETGTDAYVLQTTIERVVTVREKGKLVERRVPVVRRVVVSAPGSLQYSTELVTVAGRPRVVRQPVVRYVPRVEKRFVTVNGRASTVSGTRLVPTTTVRTRTQTAVVTAERTVTNTRTRTYERTVTATETRLRTITDTRTETAPARTVTA